MGIFDSIKATLTNAPGILTIEIGDEPIRLGEPFEGRVTFKATRDLDVLELGVRLIHQFPDRGVKEELMMDEFVMLERAAFRRDDPVERSFELEAPNEAVPAFRHYAWYAEAFVLAVGETELSTRIKVPVELSMLASGVDQVLRSQFGFILDDMRADELGLYVDYLPDASVKHILGGLTAIYDEDTDELRLGLQLQGISQGAVEHLGARYDARSQTAWLSLQRNRFGSDTPDYQGIFAELEGVFTQN